MTSPIWFWVALAIFVAGRFYDAYSSTLFVYYANEEGNKMYRNKAGLFSLTRYIIASAIVGVGITLLNIFAAPYLWTMFLPVGIGSLVVGLSNQSSNKANRVRQRAFLLGLYRLQTTGAPRDQIDAYFNEQIMVINGQRNWLTLFPWIRIVEPDIDTAHYRLHTLIAELAARPENEWFPK